MEKRNSHIVFDSGESWKKIARDISKISKYYTLFRYYLDRDICKMIILIWF